MEKPLDHVGRVMAQWARERPDLDVSPQGLIGRLHRLAAALTDELVADYGEFGLGDGEFDVLATLRRSGAPFALTPTELGESSMVSSGAVSDRDGRGRLVALTPSGRRLIDRAFTAHIANEHRLVAGLSADQRAELAALLEAWGRELEV
jgi:DNA-binding MarR family transcriptional regulator